MKKSVCSLLGAFLLFGAVGVIFAEEPSGPMPPPKVLVVDREFTKPGKGGSAHEKSESAFVQAFARAKWATHYIAATSMSGRSRTLFFIPYDSFEAAEKDNLAMAKNASLSAALDRAYAGDGDALSDTDAATLVLNEEQSLRDVVDIAQMRYFEISLFRVKPGHRHDWNELVKLVKGAYEKMPDIRWAVYEVMYGQEGNTFVVITPRKSLAEVDKEMANDKDFVANMGEDGMKKLGELEAAAIESSQTNLFQFSPAMSYVSDAWVKAAPDFWKPKAAAAKPAAKSEEKPAKQ
jgi:hypothetical protein